MTLDQLAEFIGFLREHHGGDTHVMIQPDDGMYCHDWHEVTKHHVALEKGRPYFEGREKFPMTIQEKVIILTCTKKGKS